MTQYACPHCGVIEPVPGTMQSTGAVRFRPNEIKFMTFHTADIVVEAHMCAACGAIMLRGDVQKLKLVRTAPAHEARPVGVGAEKH